MPFRTENQYTTPEENQNEQAAHRLLDSLAPLTHKESNDDGFVVIKPEEVERVKAILMGVNFRDYNFGLTTVKRNFEDYHILSHKGFPVFLTSGSLNTRTNIELLAHTLAD